MTIKEFQERLDSGWTIDCGEAKEMAKRITVLLLKLGYGHGVFASQDIIDGKQSRWRYAFITEAGCIEYCNDSHYRYKSEKSIPGDIAEAVATEYFDAITPSSEDIDQLLQEVSV